MKPVKIIPANTQNKTDLIKPVCACSGSTTDKSINQKKTQHWTTAMLETSIGRVCRVSTEWKRQDYWGQIRSRTSAFRMEYSVTPGLYAVGTPDSDSDIFVSANYKLSFDILRRELHGINAWILVLDTKGINVWCAAGKGTFGTNELISRIISVKLSSLVKHRRIILPQLGAPGIEADLVKKMTGFRVYYGPVRAADIPAYLSGNYNATKEMRTVKFTLLDRLILTPIELNPLLKKFPLFAIIMMLVFGLKPSGILFSDALNYGMPFLIFTLLSLFSGAFLTPVLLPFIPFRSFALKGWLMGALTIFISSLYIDILNINNLILNIFIYLFFPLLSSYIALQFTGATTYTSISGVKKELKIAIPIYISMAVISSILVIAYKISEWGLI